MRVRKRAFVFAALLLAAASWGPQPALAAPDESPTVLPEPAVTVGTTNTIRWSFPADGWYPPSSEGRKDEGFLVSATDLTTGQVKAVSVSGAFTTSASVTGLIDGHAYRYVVRARHRECTTSFVFNCTDYGNLNSGPPSTPVTSTQDATAPSGTIAIEGGAQFTNRLAVNVQLVAADLGPGASGVGFVQFSETASLACPLQALTCVSSYAPQLQVALAPGTDGSRTLYARFFDRARGPSAPAAPSIFERMPPGNRSASTSDTIVVDTKGPALSVTRSAEPAMLNVPVSFDASGSRDQAGFGADSGLDAGTAVWDFGDGTRASGLAVSHTYRAAGNYTTELIVRDRAGNEARTQLPVTVLPAGTPGGATTTTTPPTQTPDTTDRIAPTLAGVGLRRRAGRARLLFRLSEQATVVVELRRLRPRPVRSLGRVTRAGVVGANRVVLPLSFSRLLRRRGTYELVVVARDASGNVSQLRRLRVVTR